jgi:hypothetical protein
MPDRLASATAPLAGIAIRPVEKFPEPAFSRLQHSVFADIQEYSDTLAAIISAERETVATALAGATPVQAPMHRLGAFDGDVLVGWSCGWMERGGTFYMANSGVIASHRRLGIYTMLLKSVQDLACGMGAITLRSQHSVLNNPVLIAKLRHGFHVSGLSHSAQMGTLVELSFHCAPQRQALLRSRVIPFAVPLADGAGPGA